MTGSVCGESIRVFLAASIPPNANFGPPDAQVFASQGQTGEAIISFLGDAALLLGGGLAKLTEAGVLGSYAAKITPFAKEYRMTATAIEFSIGGTRAIQGGYVIYKDGLNHQAAGYLGEAVLRLIGATVQLKSTLAETAEEADDAATAELRLTEQTVSPWRLLEQKAKDYGEDILARKAIESKIGNSDQGFDFLSYEGSGANPKLYINEAKDYAGKVPDIKFTTFGRGNGGSAIFERNMTRARDAIIEADLDEATRRALIKQLENKTAQIQLWGSATKGTVFDQNIKDLITEETGLQFAEDILLK